jgi:hypothetical protein
LKDGRTALAFKVENAVDMETGAIVAVTTHGGATADTTTVEATVIEPGVTVAAVAGETAPEVSAEGGQEVVADQRLTGARRIRVVARCSRSPQPDRKRCCIRSITHRTDVGPSGV